MESDVLCVENIAVRPEQKAEIGTSIRAVYGYRRSEKHVCEIEPWVEINAKVVETLRAAVKELRTRCTLYSMVQARNSILKARREMSFAAVPAKYRPTHLADALLYDDPRPGYAGPGIVSLDLGGTLTLARELPRMVLCLKIYYVYEVNPLWNVPLRAVADLKAWLDRQFLASQDITPMPKLNPRAITTLDQIWEFLAQFDANIQHKSTFVRATPTDLGFRTAIVEASVIPQTRLTPLMTSPEGAQNFLTDSSRHIAYLGDQKELALAGLGNCRKLLPQNADMSLLCENQAQQAEIARLTDSITKYGGRMRSANDNIRALRNEVRDAQDQISELQDKYKRAKKRADGLDDNRARAEALARDLTRIPPESLQQASDLSAEISSAATKLANIIEAHAIIRPGVTERTLQDLQVVVDVLQGTANDIKDEAAVRPCEDKDGDVDMDDDAGGKEDDGENAKDDGGEDNVAGEQHSENHRN